MDLKVTDKRMDTNPIRNRFTQGEALVDRPRIILPTTYQGLDISGYSYEMRAASNKDTLVRQPLEKSIEEDKLVLLWTVTKEITAIPCKLYLTVVGMDETGEEIIKITSDGIFIRADPDGNYNPPPANLLEDALRQMQQIQAAVNSANIAAAESKQAAEEAAEAAADSDGAAQAAAARAEAAAQAAQKSAEEAKTMATNAKGWYADPESLWAAYPTGENGWWAVVGTTDTIWTWDSDTAAWVNSGEKSDLSEYPTWTDLAGKLLVPCNCIYGDGTHTITVQSVKQITGVQYTIVMIPTHDYTAGDTVTVAGEPVAVQYQASDAAVQSGAWLAGRPVQAEYYDGTLYLAANQPSQSGDGNGNVFIQDGAEIILPEEWGHGPWQFEVVPDEGGETGGDTPGGATTGGQNVAGYVGEIVYFADSILRPNHVWADGAAIDTETWQELAEYAATAGWEQDEDGQYHTPDLRGRFLLGASADHVVGTEGGEETHTLTVDEIPNIQGKLGGIASQSNSEGIFASGVFSKSIDGAYGGHGTAKQAWEDTISMNFGGGQPHNNMPPFFTAAPQIRAKVDVIYARAVKVDAADVDYNNTESGLQADRVQGAIDEIAEKQTGLINIDDIEFTSSIDAPIFTQSVKVVNGVLCGCAFIEYHKDTTFTLSCNYNITGDVGIRAQHSGNDAALRYPASVAMNNGKLGPYTICGCYFSFSAPWNPAWIKKEDA